MGEDTTDTLTIRQAATLLGVHPNTVRNRIKAGMYEAEKVVTEHGETYVLSRAELERVEADKATTNPMPSASHSQPLSVVREAVQELIAPFVRELGEAREELGREKERRERAERRVEELERQLEAPASEPQEPQNQAEDAGSRPDRGSVPEEAEKVAKRRSWWRRWFSGERSGN